MKTKQDIHIGIVELETEEEYVYTLYHLSKLSGFKVSLFISHRIWKLISGRIDQNYLTSLVVFNENTFAEIVDTLVSKHTKIPVDIYIFPRFIAHTKHELQVFKMFFNKYNHLVAIFNYTRWFSKIPPIKYNGYKIIKRWLILDWYYCHSIFPSIRNICISDIHLNSSNPLKQFALTSSSIKNIIDIPFKMPTGEYNPNYNYDYPVFIIPGSIDKRRRNYYEVLNVLSKLKVLNNTKWKLILLGRPIGRYGKKIINYSKKINNNYRSERVKYFKEYVSYDVYRKMMDKGTHILAPIKPKSYNHGKDSGALYDVFTYNKIGIFKHEYFYNEKLTEMGVVHTYKNHCDLKSILYSIIMKKFDYSLFSTALGALNSEITIENYKSSYSKFIQLVK
jgi:hypothetical protein